MSPLIWVVFFIFLLFILLVFVISYRNIYIIPASYGQYGPGIAGLCSVSCTGVTNDAEITGTATLVSRCIPNSQTGLGCLVNGVQTYKPQISIVPCSITCPSYRWENTQVVPCGYYSTDIFNTQAFTGCINDVSLVRAVPLQGVRRICIATGLMNGLNECVLTDGLTAQPGQLEEVITTCTNIPNARCGQFQTCNVSLNYIYTNNITTTVLPPFNLFHEGVSIIPSVCRYINATGEPVSITPGPGDPPSSYCTVNTVPCRNNIPTPMQVATKTIPDPTIITVCGNNPSCLQLGRYYPVSTSGAGPELTQVLNRPFYIYNDGNFVGQDFSITGNQTVDFVWRNIGNTPVGCSAVDYLRTNGTLFWFSPDTDGPGNFTGRLFAISGASDVGWVTLGPTQLALVQSIYLNINGTISEGATYLNASVVNFNVVFNSSTPSPPGAVSWTGTFNFAIGGIPLTNMTLFVYPSNFASPFNALNLNASQVCKLYNE